MRLLLDTHIFLWYILDDKRLPDRWRELLRDPTNSVFLSVISIWETCLKHQLGKLPLPENPALLLPAQRQAHQIEFMALTEECFRHLQTLPNLHKDPFDRVLICQAIENDCQLLTDDSTILTYPTHVLPL